MAKTDYRTIDEYHDAFPDEVREKLEQIRATISQVAPEAEGVISYQIPAFRMGKKFLIYYAGFTKHISLSSPWSEALLREFEEELKELKVSKSAIQFPNDKPLPLGFIKKIVEFRQKEVAG
ncbi:iron chaperone [Chryseobacterium gossypii]|uniref:iron chaperone n=1 Tax=Chryseobacterium gossypii TaxID=3231602 RepID=UPI0035248872